MKVAAIISSKSMIVPVISEAVREYYSDVEILHFRNHIEFSLADVRPDLLIIELLIESGNVRYNLVKIMARITPSLIVIGELNDPMEILSCYRNGAIAYFNHSESIDELKSCISAAFNKRLFANSDLIYAWIRQSGGAENKSSKGLSPRQFEIAERLTNGERATDIAHDLSISLSSVSATKRSILKKFNVNSISGLLNHPDFKKNRFEVT